MEFKLPIKKDISILALGAESAGNFSAYIKGKIYFSEDFGDLLDDKNWHTFQKEVLLYLRNNHIIPEIILADLHPLFKTTSWSKTLSKKYKAQHIFVQHHIAHIFSSIGDKIIQDTKYKIPDTIYGIACDGTGYGLDGNIWGGEIFKVESIKYKVESIKRISHLENQILIGGDLAIKEPARMLISILDKVFSSPSTSPLGRGRPVLRAGEGTNVKQRKKLIYSFAKKYYTQNQFELLYNQLEQNFNCQNSSSTGRILDAVSLLLGFCKNERKYKHEPIDLLEKNSTIPYDCLIPKIVSTANLDIECPSYILDTTYLFKYLIKNIHKDKKRLAATAQIYIAEGLYEILLKGQRTMNNEQQTFFAGGIANNKIISSYLESKNIYTSKKVPRGDTGISIGQIIYYLLLE